MKITRRNPFDRIERTMDLPITQEQLDDWKSGTLIQRAFPNLNADQREFLMTGITPDQWDDIFPEDDDE